MKALQTFSDQFAIGLSLLCTVHCLILPFALVLIPSLSGLHLADECYHLWMLIVVIPTSVIALSLGCKQHQHYRLLLWGFAGLLLLCLAVLGESMIGETGEKTLTLFGTALVATGHLMNYHLCQQHNDCPCPEHNSH